MFEILFFEYPDKFAAFLILVLAIFSLFLVYKESEKHNSDGLDIISISFIVFLLGSILIANLFDPDSGLRRLIDVYQKF